MVNCAIHLNKTNAAQSLQKKIKSLQMMQWLIEVKKIEAWRTWIGFQIFLQERFSLKFFYESKYEAQDILSYYLVSLVKQWYKNLILFTSKISTL